MAQEKKDNIIKKAVQGRLVSLSFFLHYWYLVAGVLIMLIAFIANKYHCQTQLAEIMSLSKDLNNAKTECVKASSEYNSQIRETEMRSLIDTLKMDIRMPLQPPYKISSNEAKE